MSSQIINDWIEYYEIVADKNLNTREFRVSIENGTHRLSDISHHLDDLIKKAPHEGWKIILGLVEKANSDLILAQIAAGPLENLLSWHPHDFIDLVETAARQDLKFRKCLTGVWKGTVPDKIWSRIEILTRNCARV